MSILVTGGAGFIGSHTCVELMRAGYDIVIVDNLSNSKEESLKRVQEITGKSLSFHKVDLLDVEGLDAVFHNGPIEAVIHFAGLKAVGESVSIPLDYYKNNVSGTLNLLEVMQANQVKSIVFSSSATVYGEPHAVPITEDFPLNPATNPYGRTKRMIEDIFRDLAIADPDWNIALLRYFNPVGAHESGRIGEDPITIHQTARAYVITSM
jgi:UDP-glucose 4-epimerase